MATTAVAAVARARDGGHPGVLARAPGADPERGGRPHRHHARHGAPDPADAGEARARALRRAALLAHSAPADPRLGLPVLTEPVRARAAADGGRSSSRRTSRARPPRSTCPTSSTSPACPRGGSCRSRSSVGTRLPAHCTSMGRVLWPRCRTTSSTATSPDVTLAASTERTATDPERLRAVARRDAPARLGARRPGARDRPALGGGPHPPRPDTIAALNVSSAVSRVSLDDLRRRILPPLVKTPNTISNALTSRVRTTAPSAERHAVGGSRSRC